MGFFDFFKPKKNEALEAANAMLKQVFPNGELDYEAGTNEILEILNFKISRDVARNIFVKSTMICRIVSSKKDVESKFDFDRLKLHLSGYCIEHFSDDQIHQLHGYQVSLLAASLFGISPKDVRKTGSGYAW
jgi:hypothetical protein